LRNEVRVTDDVVEMYLIPDTNLDSALLAEFATVNGVPVDVSKTEHGIVLKKVRK